MSVSTAHTALETLLLFQSLARYGTEATSFRRISELLKDNALVREATAFDTGRLSPEALRQLYHDLLKQEEAAEHATPPEGDDSDSHPPSGREGGRDGPGPSPSRKRKLPSPSPTAARDASRHATLLPQLVDRLYVRYKDNVVRAIRDDEARYQHLRQDIQQIELGQWDERLKQQPVPAAVEFAEGAPNESALHRDTPADPQPVARSGSRRSPSRAQKGSTNYQDGPTSTAGSRLSPDRRPVPASATPSSRALNTGTAASGTSASSLRQTTIPATLFQRPASSDVPLVSPTKAPLLSTAAPTASVPSLQAPRLSPPSTTLSLASDPDQSDPQPAVLERTGAAAEAVTALSADQPLQAVSATTFAQGSSRSSQPSAPSPLSSHELPGPAPSSEPSRQGAPVLSSPRLRPLSSSAAPPATSGPPSRPMAADAVLSDRQPAVSPSTSQESRGLSGGPVPHATRSYPSSGAQHRSGVMQALPQTPVTSAPGPRYARRPPPLDTSASSTRWKTPMLESSSQAPGSPLRPPPSPLSDAASPSRMETRRDRRGHTRGQASRTLGRSPASVSDATDTAHAPRSDARRTRRGMAKPGGGMSTRRRRGSTASSHTHDSTRATSRSRSRSRSTEDVTPITRVKDEHPSTPFGVATDHDIEMSGASTTDEVPHLRLGHAALMDAMELRGEGNKRKRSLRDTPEVADSGSSRHGTPLGPARSRHIVSTPHFARTTAPVLNDIAAHKHASLFAAPVKERDAPGYRNIIYYPQDLKSIKTAIAVGGRAVAAAAGSVGTPADGRESPGASGSAQKSSTVLITPTLDVIPPRAIVNSAQLEKELMRMFANAIMFNFDPDRGFGTGLADRSGVDGDGPVEGGVAEAEDDEGSVVRDTREMVEAVEKTVGDWRAVERSLKEPSM